LKSIRAVLVVVVLAVAALAPTAEAGKFTFRGIVIRVVDGDTLDVRLTSGVRTRVRLIGIDSPERGDCYAAKATSRARTLALGERVVLRGDATQDTRDRFGRLLAYLSLPGGRDLGLQLIRGGFGEVSVIEKPFRRLGTYRSAEQAARDAGLGLWSACVAPSPPPPPPPPPPPATTGMKVAAVGDIQPCSSSSNSAATANVAAAADFILGLGDYQYDSGTLSCFNANFDKDWGPNVPKMYPVLAPNHDQYWRDADPLRYFNGAGASGFKVRIPLQPHQSYSFDRGSWHFIAIDDACYRDTANCSTSALLSWVKADLAAHPNLCTVAYWHQAYWTSPTGTHGRFLDIKPVVQALYDRRVDIVLNGHQHGYERFHPQNMSDVRDDAQGIRSFTVGTGGIGFYAWTGTAANSVVKQADTFGVLMLTLADGSYDWSFLRAAGGSFADSGSGVCH